MEKKQINGQMKRTIIFSNGHVKIGNFSEKNICYVVEQLEIEFGYKRKILKNVRKNKLLLSDLQKNCI